MKHLLTTLLACALCTAAAQHENDIWFMGTGSAGMRYDPALKIFKPYSVHKPLGAEGCAVATDPASGELLFYTDGRKVYTSEHQIMQGGDDLGGCSSSAQAAAIVPVPNGCGKYYVFSNSVGTVPPHCTNDKVLYSIVDMNKNEGLGAVVQGPTPMRDVLEGMIAIPKPNSSDFWLVGSDNNPGSTFYAFDITAAGISPSPMFFNIGPTERRYTLTYSGVAKKIAVCYPGEGMVWVFDFDALSGTLSNAQQIESDFTRAYGCEWSPDGSKLYCSNWKDTVSTIQVRQYDLNKNWLMTVVGKSSNSYGGGLKLGPDNKIYFISDRDSPYLSCITDPDQAGLACGFQPNYVSVGADIKCLNLPATLTPPWSPPGCYRPAWRAFVSSTDQYKEPDEVLCEVIQNGMAHIPKALSAHPTNYYWTQFSATLPRPAQFSGTLKMECRVRNSQTTNGIAAFDVGMWMSDGTQSGRVYFMGIPTAAIYAGIGFGEQKKDTLPELVTDFEEWQILSLEIRPGLLLASLNGQLRYTFHYKGTLCKLSAFGVSFKGSGELDWIKLYDSGTQIYQEDFDSPVEFACLQADPANDPVINRYAAVQMLCGNRLTVSDGSAFQPGDNVLLIQMQGAEGEVSETADCGRLITYGKAGNYEMNVVDRVDGNRIYLKNKLLRDYDIAGKVQLVFVPDIGDGILGCVSCPAWDGSTGGVLAFIGGDVTLTGDLDVSGKGFPGGVFYNEIMVDNELNISAYNFPSSLPKHWAAYKGQGIATWLDAAARGKGCRANSGGGGNSHNCGGGGGSNGGNGGLGGVWIPNTYTGGGGIGGRALAYNNSENRIFMGGGGGAGHSNNGKGSRGGNGGGIIIASVRNIQIEGGAIRANGEDAPTYEQWRQALVGNGDGGGGGGGGGTVLLEVSGSASPNLLLETKGGTGSSVGRIHGHGGGGGGGVVWVNVWPGGNAALTGGDAGIGIDGTRNGATAGTNGLLLTGLDLPRSQVLYENLTLTDLISTPDCYGTARLELTASGGKSPWQYTGDGGGTWGDTPIFEPLAAGKYPVAVRDACGETAEALVEVVTVPPLQIGLPTVRERRCDSLGIVFTEPSGGKGLLLLQLSPDTVWQTSHWFGGLEGGATYTLIVRDALGCTATVEVPVADLSETVQVTVRPDITVVHGAVLPMFGSASNTYAATYRFAWSPAYGLTNASSPVTLATPEITTTYTLRVTDQYGCTGEADAVIMVKEPLIYFPNAFCPECGGDNGYFTAMSADGVLKMRYLRVFDRWGNQVFEAKNFQPGDWKAAWRGDFQGKTLPPGVYVWQAEAEVLDGSAALYRGDVMLMR